MNAIARRGFRVIARAVLGLCAPLILAACSGSVSGPPQTNDPARITIQPDTAILYSGKPTTFRVAGGTGTFIVSSSDQSIVRIPDAVVRSGEFTVVPANVAVETPVTISVRDTGTAPVATAALTVRPGTVSNEITITPSGTQGGSCAPAVCSGGDAVLTATISQGGVPLPARGVRLDVVSGDFRFVTSPPGVPEILDTSATVITDETGAVHARIRALPGAANQTAIVQVTDLGTLAFQRAVFLIAQATGESPGFFVTPSEVTFAGPREDRCADGLRARFFVFGGVPPYTISNTAPGTFDVSATSVSASGGSFEIEARGVCVAEPGLPIVVRDAAGRTTTVQVANVPGTAEVPPLVVAPEVVTLSSCEGVATVVAAGGSGFYTASTTSDLVRTSGAGPGGLISIQRRRNTTSEAPTNPFSVFVGISDGASVAEVEVILSGPAANTTCP